MPPTGSMTISTTAGAVTDMSMEVFTFTGTACAPTLDQRGMRNQQMARARCPA
ncbi:MAG: hypothetical protein IPG92_07065 [Flavobacteriales bacterium]|nr:hypothetical protein [Flavobacteriales bacterium]